MKVAVIGAGFVGATTGQRIAESGLADVVVLDVADGIAKGKCLDLQQAAPVVGHSQRILGTGDYADCADADIVVMTAGVPRKPGMSRDELLEVNANIVSECMEKSAEVAPNSMIIMVTNPLDVTTYIAGEVTGFPKNRIMGMAGVLDSTRFCAFIGMELGVSGQDVSAMVLGGHGDSMVPISRSATVAGIPLLDLMDQEKIDEIVARTRVAGGEIVQLLGTGSAFYAPAAGVEQMVAAILRDEKRILPVSVWLDGQYGISGVYLGVPVKLGAGGVEEIIEVTLTDEESEALKASAGAVREVVAEYEAMVG
jgi:malate dehydrogenase